MVRELRHRHSLMPRAEQGEVARPTRDSEGRMREILTKLARAALSPG